jgi:TRAP-type C4-dicarboxylate transport system substrate-binding protein
MASEYPADNISGVGLTAFGRFIDRLTNGALKTRNLLGNEAKLGSGEMIRAAQLGRISGADAFSGAMTGADPIFGLSSLPLAFQSIQHASRVNMRARSFYERALDALDLQLLYTTIWPATGLWSNRPVESLRDLQALRMRTYDENSALFMRSLGVHAGYLPFEQAAAMVDHGTLDAVLSSGDGGAGPRIWTHLRHFTAINYAVPASIAFVSRAALAALPAAVQAGIGRAASQTAQYQLDHLSQRIANNFARMRANGVFIRETAPPEIASALRDAATPLISSWKQQVTPEAARLVDETN